MNYSVTQGVNIAQIGVALSIAVRVFSDPANITPEEWQILGMAMVALVAAVVSYINRIGKGDVTVGGFRK